MAAKKTQLTEARGFITGLTDSPPSVKTVNILGAAVTISQVITKAQGVVQINQTVVTTRAAWKAAVMAAQAQEKANQTLMTAIRQALIPAYGNDTAGLTACGIVVSPRKARTSETNTIAKAKAAATRVDNGTGKKAPAPKPTITVTDVNGQVIGAPAPAAPVASAIPAAVAPVVNEAEAPAATAAAGK